MRYRITKHNPVFRDSQGRYPQAEWTSLFDMGNPSCTPVLTLEKYLSTEDAYCFAISEICSLFHISEFTLQQVEKPFSLFYQKRILKKYGILLSKEEKLLYRSLQTGLILTIEQALSAARMILREMCWAVLEAGNCIKVEFGYDYYMYISCPVLPVELKATLSAAGLYVEDAW